VIFRRPLRTTSRRRARASPRFRFRVRARGAGRRRVCQVDFRHLPTNSISAENRPERIRSASPRSEVRILAHRGSRPSGAGRSSDRQSSQLGAEASELTFEPENAAVTPKEWYLVGGSSASLKPHTGAAGGTEPRFESWQADGGSPAASSRRPAAAAAAERPACRRSWCNRVEDRDHHRGSPTRGWSRRGSCCTLRSCALALPSYALARSQGQAQGSDGGAAH
jgi:hypothetical protein